METTIKLEGWAEMEKYLEALGPVVARKIADQALKPASKLIADEARRTAPEATGQLKAHITEQASYVVNRTRGDQRARLVGVSAPEYRLLSLLMYGTRFMPANPFFRDAYDTKRREALDLIERGLRSGIERESSSTARQAGVKR